MGNRKNDDDKPSPVKLAVLGGLVVACVLIGFRLLLDALHWWAGGPGPLTARIGVGLLAALLAVLYLRHKVRSRSK